MREAFDDSRLGHPLQLGARLAQLDAEAFDVADAEALPDELVDVDTARDDVAAGFPRLNRDPVLTLHRLHRFGGDERQGRAGRRFAVEEVPVAFEPATG